MRFGRVLAVATLVVGCSTTRPTDSPASTTAPTVEPTTSTSTPAPTLSARELSDAFWAQVIDYAPGAHDYASLDEIVADSDLIVRGRVTGRAFVSCAAAPSPVPGEPDICEGNRILFALVTIDERLKADGHQTLPIVMVRLDISSIPDGELPQEDLLLFLKNVGEAYAGAGIPTPSDSPRWDWYAPPNQYQGLLRNLDGVVDLPEAPDYWWNDYGPFPSDIEGQPFDTIVQQVRDLVGPASSAAPDTACVGGAKHDATMTEFYEGVCYGWRVGHEDPFSDDRYDRKLHLDCTPELFGSSIETSGPPWGSQKSDLDIHLSSLPAGMTLEHIDKWTCGSMGISDHAVLTDVETGAQIDISRGLDGSGWLVVDAMPGTVRSCRVGGLPAVCVDQVPISDYSMSIASVFVLEHATLDPYGVVLRLWSDELSVDELSEIAERVVR